MTILNVKAEWYVRDGEENKTETYKLLNLIHAMAGSIANATTQFHLARSCTESHYVFTEWTNGIVDIGAETYRQDGEDISHHYYIRPCKGDL